MDLQQDKCNSSHEWEFMALQLTNNIDGFDIVKTQDRFDCDRYYWKCRDDRGMRKTSTDNFNTPKECLIDFLCKIEGFWFG